MTSGQYSNHGCSSVGIASSNVFRDYRLFPSAMHVECLAGLLVRDSFHTPTATSDIRKDGLLQHDTDAPSATDAVSSCTYSDELLYDVADDGSNRSGTSSERQQDKLTNSSGVDAVAC